MHRELAKPTEHPLIPFERPFLLFQVAALFDLLKIANESFEMAIVPLEVRMILLQASDHVGRANVFVAIGSE